MCEHFTFDTTTTVSLAALLAPDFPASEENSVFYRLEFAADGVILRVMYMTKSAQQLRLFSAGASHHAPEAFLAALRDRFDGKVVGGKLASVTIYSGVMKPLTVKI
jgi:hypothetical protein